MKWQKLLLTVTLILLSVFSQSCGLLSSKPENTTVLLGDVDQVTQIEKDTPAPYKGYVLSDAAFFLIYKDARKLKSIKEKFNSMTAAGNKKEEILDAILVELTGN